LNIFYLTPKIKKIVRYEDDTTILKKLKRIFFNDRKASGGIQVIYEHADILNENNITTKVVSLGGRYNSINADWFEHKTTISYLKGELKGIEEGDLIICPEVIPQEILQFKKGKKLLFVQNWALYREGSAEKYGFDGIITLEGYCTEYMKERSNLPIFSVLNGLDLDKFSYTKELKTPNTMLILYRKNQKDIDEFIENFPEDLKGIFEFEVIYEHLEKNELIKRYEKNDIYLSFGYPEGFALPPLEAMGCGCVVIGFTGRGGDIHMIHNKTALTSRDGDVESLYAHLYRLKNEPRLKEELRVNGLEKIKEFSKQNMESSVLKLFKEVEDVL